MQKLLCLKICINFGTLHFKKLIRDEDFCYQTPSISMNFRPLYFYLQNVSVDGGLIYESFWCLCPVAVWWQ